MFEELCDKKKYKGKALMGDAPKPLLMYTVA
jgi:hypothetical protein